MEPYLNGLDVNKYAAFTGSIDAKKVMSFDGLDAKKYGSRAAVFLFKMKGWISQNKADGKHFHDGRTWINNSVADFKTIFTFWTDKQIRYLLDKLVRQKVILKGNYNKDKYNRTCWYAFYDENKIYSTKEVKNEN